MNNPWFLLAVMSLATFILTKLVVDLDFPPVLWLRDRVVGGWRPLTLAEANELRGAILTPDAKVSWDWSDLGGERQRWNDRSPWIPLFFSELMSCPWCVSAWMAAGVTGGTWLIIGLPVPVLMWFGSWALGALMAQHDYA
jgi:hypothetical protein